MMPPAAAMAGWLQSSHARFPKALQPKLFTSGLPGCAFMASIMHCRDGGWEDLGFMRVDIDGAIVTYGRVLLGWGYCKAEREWL